MIRVASLSALACALLIGTSARAADLPARAAPPVFTPVPVFTWTGFYAGINAGYGFHTGGDEGRIQRIFFPRNANGPAGGFPTGAGFTNTNPMLSGVGTPINEFTVPTTLSLATPKRHDGFVGGAQIGYNYQFTPGTGVVIGFEADAQYADLGSSRGFSSITVPALPVPIGPPLFNPVAAVEREFEGLPGNPAAGLRSVTFLAADRAGQGVEWFGTVRGRLGYAVDRVLFYGTGGFAYGEGRRVPVGFNGSSGGLRAGWTAGGGVEFALPSDSWLNFLKSDAVTLKIEGLYVSLDPASVRNASGSVLYARDQNGYSYYAPASRVSYSPARSLRDDFAVARVGLNYKFGTY